MSQILSTALYLLADGVACIPVDREKVPVIKSWRQYMETAPSEDEIKTWFSHANGIALVAGAIQCIDIDEKYRSGLKDQFELRCREAGLGGVLDSCLLQKTPSGGYHLVFRSEGEPFRNMKLAQKSATEKREVLIETRGTGGYFLIEPSKGYKVLRGDFAFLPTLSEDERDDLLDVARSFNENIREDYREEMKSRGVTSGDLSPGDDFDQRGDLPALLRSHGWTQTDSTHWRRPGKDRGISASLGHVPGRFYVFSTSTEFEPEKPYKPYAVYAMLEHDGDFKAAGRALKAQGYGSARPPERKPLMEAVGGTDVDEPRNSLERARKAKSKEEQEAEEEALLRKLSAIEFWPGPEPEDERCLFKLAGVEVAHVGNHLALVAPVKSGKSAFVGAFIAASCGKSHCSDLLGFEPTNFEERAVIHIDTEQSRNDHHRLITRSLRRAGVDVVPDHLLSFCMTGWDPAEIISSIDYLAKKAGEAFGGVHSIIIDGIADLISTPNDEEEANKLERWVRNLAIRNECCVVNVIHMNPGGRGDAGKSRGHLGSQLERKAETVLFLDKENEVTMVYSTRTRRAPITKQKAPCFEWSDDAKAHVSCVNAFGQAKAKAPTSEDRMDMAVAHLRTLLVENVWEIHELHNLINAKFSIGQNARQKAISIAAESVPGTDKVKPKAGRTAPWIIGPMQKVAERRLKMEQEFEAQKQKKIKV